MRDEEYAAMFEMEERLWWYDGMRRVTSSLLNGTIEKSRRVRLLDVGCGTGYSLAWLTERLGAGGAFGIDASGVAASFWKRRGINAAVASISALPFEARQFDLITCFDVIYQLDEKQAIEAVSEIGRVLKPGGLFLIREPAYEWMRGSHDVAVGTRHRYTLTELKKLLRRCGLDSIRSTYANTILFGAAIPHRIVSRLKGGTASDVKPVAPWANRLFMSALRFEAMLLRRISFPFGLSAIVVARKSASG
jgi:SAM-dependent methyltransferase